MGNKVLLTASTYSHIRNFHLPYLEHFRSLGWTVHIGCANLPEEITCAADRIISLPFEKSMSSPSNFRAASLLRKIITEENYDLIVTHTSLAAFFTRLAVLGLRKRPRLINMVHGYLFDDDTNPIKKQVLLSAERVTAPVTDLLLTMNQWDFDAAQRYHLGKQVANVPGIGVDFTRMQLPDRQTAAQLRADLGIHSDDFVLIYAAEFSARKSQRVLIEAMKELPSNTVLVLPGDGTLLQQCKDLALTLGVRVIFPGYVRDMQKWYGIANAAVSSSRSEGLPFNIMEAMYCGLPIVASRVKGHVDLLSHRESGLLYPYGDSTSFAQCVQELRNSPELSVILSEHARHAVEPYALNCVLPEVFRHYESFSPTAAPSIH